MQKEILEAHPNTPITVIAIWFSMVKNDSRQGLAPDLLTDFRVLRRWDPDNVVGTWYGESLTRRNAPGTEWDAWFLYGPDATWDQAAKPITWGRPVLATSPKLQEAFNTLLTGAAPLARPAGGQR